MIDEEVDGESPSYFAVIEGDGAGIVLSLSTLLIIILYYNYF